MDNNDFLKSLSKSLIEATKSVLEGKAHTVPKTEKEKKLAALAEPKDKITHADVLKGRGVVKEEEQIDELSVVGLDKYHSKAYQSMFDKDSDKKTVEKRKKGMDMAYNKAGFGKAKVYASEEAEQIDELSTPTLRKYREKARDDAFDADAVDDERRLRKRSFGHNQAGKKIIKRGDTLRTEEVQMDERWSENSKKTSKNLAAMALDTGNVATGGLLSKSKLAKKAMKWADSPDETTSKSRLKAYQARQARKANEEVQIDEAMNAADRFKHHHDHAKALLKSISDHLKSEHEAATKHTDYRGNKGPHWGHVGSMEHVANQLSNIHDMLARKGEYAESVEVEDEVTLTEAELQALEQIAETIEVEETEELDEARGRPKLPRDAQGNIIRGGSTAKASVAKADEEPAALGYQLRKAASINKPVHFMNGEKKEVSNQHINAFNDHMAARKTAAEKAAFQSKAHKSHAEFVKAVSAPVPHAKKDTGEIVKYR